MKRLSSFTGDENTESKPRTMNDVSKDIKAAGVPKDPAGADDETANPGEAPIGTEQRAVADGINDAGQKNPATIEPPSPGKKSPEELAKSPEEYLEPQEGPEKEGGAVNAEIVGEMGADKGLTDVLKDTFADYIDGRNKSKPMERIDSTKHMSKLGREVNDTYLGFEYEVLKVSGGYTFRVKNRSQWVSDNKSYPGVAEAEDAAVKMIRELHRKF